MRGVSPAVATPLVRRAYHSGGPGMFRSSAGSFTMGNRLSDEGFAIVRLGFAQILEETVHIVTSFSDELFACVAYFFDNRIG